MLTALLIEDDYDLANTVIDFLSLENIECDHASNGVSGLTLLQQNRYGIVLLDLNLPRLDGLQVPYLVVVVVRYSCCNVVI